MSNINKRFISAFFFIGFIALLYYFLKDAGLMILGFLLAALSIFEYNKIAFSKESKSLQIIFVLLTYTNFFIYFNKPSFIVLSLALSFLCFLFYIVTHAKTIEHSQDSLNKCLAGFFYVGLLPALFCRFFLVHPEGVFYLILTLICVVSTDVCAYFAGILMGKRPLHPLISPKKTVEGAFAGVLGAVLISLLFAYIISWPSKLLILTPFLILASIAAQLGDLFESVLKRHAQVKDSGKILPGHGGILDRIDGLLFATPIFVLYDYISHSTFV